MIWFGPAEACKGLDENHASGALSGPLRGKMPTSWPGEGGTPRLVGTLVLLKTLASAGRAVIGAIHNYRSMGKTVDQRREKRQLGGRQI